MGRLKNIRKDLVRKVDPRFQSYISPFEQVRDKTGIFKATGNKAQKRVKKLINRELKTERWLRWTLKKDARVLRRKESFCEDAKGNRAGFLYALSGLSRDAGLEVSVIHKKLFDEIATLRAVIHTQKGFVTRIHALEKKEWNVAGELQHALTIMHTNANELKRVIDSREQASITAGRDSVKVAGETSRLNPKGVRDLLAQEDATLAREMHSVQTFFDDCGQGLRVIEKWGELLNLQDLQLEQMQALNTERLDPSVREAKEAEHQQLLLSRLNDFSNTVRNEITLLHVMLKDGKVKHEVLKELKSLAEAVEYLENKTKAKTRRWKASQQFGFLLVGRAAEAAILKVAFEVLQDEIVGFGKAVDEMVATSEAVYEIVGPGSELAIQYAIEAEYILQNKGEMVQEIGGVVADEVGERVDNGITKIENGLSNIWARVNGEEPQQAPPPKVSVRARPKREYKVHTIDDLRPSERKKEIKEMQAGVDKFMAGYGKVQKVKEFPRTVHEKVNKAKKYIGVDSEPVPNVVPWGQFMPNAIFTLLAAIWTWRSVRKTGGWALFETITGIKERKEKEIARKLYKTQYDDIKKQFEIIAQKLVAKTRRIQAKKDRIKAKGVKLKHKIDSLPGQKQALERARVRLDKTDAKEKGLPDEVRKAQEHIDKLMQKWRSLHAKYAEGKLQVGSAEEFELRSMPRELDMAKKFKQELEQSLPDLQDMTSEKADMLNQSHMLYVDAKDTINEIRTDIDEIQADIQEIEAYKAELIQEAEQQGDAAVVVMREMLAEFQKIEADMDEKRAERGFFYRWGRRIVWTGGAAKNTVVWPFRKTKQVANLGFGIAFPRLSRGLELGGRLLGRNKTKKLKAPKK